MTAVDYKGPIGTQKWYLHTQMDTYSKYPEVHMTKSTGIKELKGVLAKTMRSHGKPIEIWSDLCIYEGVSTTYSTVQYANMTQSI